MMINKPLLRWEMHRLRWWYTGLLIFFGIGLVMLLFAETMEIERHPFLSFGIVWAVPWGMSLFNRELQDGNVDFLLTRPVARRELYNTLVPVWGVPLVLLMFLPLLDALALSPLLPHLPLDKLAAGDFIAAVWVVAMYLLGVLFGLFVRRSDNRHKWYLLGPVLVLQVAVFVSTTGNAGYDRLDLNFQIQHHPWLASAVGLVLALLSYCLGLRRFEGMDI